MNQVFESNVLEVSTSTGAGTIALSGMPGFARFADVLTVGAKCHYMIKAVDEVGRPTGAYEFGVGTYSATNTLTRTTVVGSSNGGNAVSFSIGDKFVSFTALAPTTDALRFDWQDAIGMNLAGAVQHFAMSAAPSGWLKANGAAVSRTTYARLFSKIGGTFGAGDGSTTFNLPDLRGEFIRGWDDARTLDNGRGFATVQGSQNLSHAHSVYDPAHSHSVYDPGHAHGAWTDAQGNHDHGIMYIGTSGWRSGIVDTGTGTSSGFLRTEGAGNHSHNVGVGASGTGISLYGAGTGISIYADGGAEARPRNVALLACIKY